MIPPRAIWSSAQSACGRGATRRAERLSVCRPYPAPPLAVPAVVDDAVDRAPRERGRRVEPAHRAVQQLRRARAPTERGQQTDEPASGTSPRCVPATNTAGTVKHMMRALYVPA